MYATTNPDNPFHYVKTDYIDRMDLRAEGKINVVEYRLEDNPNLDEEYLDTVRKLYKGVFKLRFIDGLWVMAHGSVFRDVWDESKILYSAKDEPIGLRGSGGYQRRWITVDYGTGNPTCFLDWYDDGKYYWLVNEYYWDSKKEARQKTDSEYASDLIEWMHKGGRPGCEVIVDPSAASFKLELQRRGVWVKNAKNDVLDGIRLTSTMLGNGIIRVNRDACPMVLKEMPNYSWDPNAAKLGEDKPIKANDHSCDPFRYACATVFDQYRRAA
jgi:PBSX family phage terminase large subunit